MNRKSWLVALVALVLGAGIAVAITQGADEDTTSAAPPTETTDTETSDSGKKESKGSGEKKGADDEKAAEQEVEQTVNAYVDALAEGDTEAVCNIQAEALTVKVTASGISGEEIAEACAEAASQLDWAELWAAWASQIDLDDVHVDVNGGQAKVSLNGGAGFSLDRQRSGEWKIDGLKLPGANAGRSVPQMPGGGGGPSGGGGLPSGGAGGAGGTLPGGGGGGGTLPSGGGGGGTLPSGGGSLPSGGGLPSPQRPSR